jgi:hypothetical protein
MHRTMQVARGEMRSSGLLATALAALVASATCMGTLAAREEESGVAEPSEEEGGLRDTLLLWDSQEGFAGATGTVWAIEPSGAWREARFFNEKIDSPDREGQLTDDELQRVVDTLERMKLGSLPPQLGRDVKVNPHTFVLEIGEHRSVLRLRPGETLSPGTEPEGSALQREQWRRFAAIAREILAVTSQGADDPARTDEP